MPASDLVEGILNNADRPPVYNESNSFELYQGQPLPHFIVVVECAGVDSILTNWSWKALDLDPSTTLHDVRWGQVYKDEHLNDFVWVLQISGGAPPNHFVNGYRGAISERQPPMYFPLGGGTLKGVGHKGPIVWSRIFVEDNSLHLDIGLGEVVELPPDELDRRWKNTTSQWPIVNTIFHGVTRDSFMARHRANHVNIAYTSNFATSVKALEVKAAMAAQLGIKVHLCGKISPHLD